jgi:hypothetical protein
MYWIATNIDIIISSVEDIRSCDLTCCEVPVRIYHLSIIPVSGIILCERGIAAPLERQIQQHYALIVPVPVGYVLDSITIRILGVVPVASEITSGVR